MHIENLATKRACENSHIKGLQGGPESFKVREEPSAEAYEMWSPRDGGQAPQRPAVRIRIHPIRSLWPGIASYLKEGSRSFLVEWRQGNSDRPPCFVLRITLRNSRETCTTASGISQTVNKCQGFCSVRAAATVDVSKHPNSRIEREWEHL